MLVVANCIFCFVDFRKAFDSVIHPGLQIKLNELDIYGKCL